MPTTTGQYCYLVCSADRYELPVAEFSTSAAAARYIGCSPEMVRLNLWRQRHLGARHRIGVWHRGQREPYYIEKVPLDDDDGQMALFSVSDDGCITYGGIA